MTRFLMTLDQSVDLVKHALVHTEGGEIFVKKAPACSVIDLAKAMLVKYSDGDFDRIKVVGIRPGEKIDEVLVNEYEIQRAIETDSFFHVEPEYKHKSLSSAYPLGYEYTSANTERYTDYIKISELLDQMGEIEYFT